MPWPKTVGRPKKVRASAHPVIAQITELQQARNLTDSELCRLAGYHTDMMSAWRRYVRKPNLQALTDVAEVFGYDVRLVPKSASK